MEGLLAAVRCHSHSQPCVSSSRGFTRLIKPTIVTPMRDEPRQPSCFFYFFLSLSCRFFSKCFCSGEERKTKQNVAFKTLHQPRRLEVSLASGGGKLVARGGKGDKKL